MPFCHYTLAVRAWLHVCADCGIQLMLLPAVVNARSTPLLVLWQHATSLSPYSQRVKSLPSCDVIGLKPTARLGGASRCSLRAGGKRIHALLLLQTSAKPGPPKHDDAAHLC
jgi:hypothetical protein